MPNFSVYVDDEMYDWLKQFKNNRQRSRIVADALKSYKAILDDREHLSGSGGFQYIATHSD